MSFLGGLSAAILALAVAAASRGHDAMTVATLVALAGALALLAQLERARDFTAMSPDVVWVRRVFRLFSRLSFEWAAPYNVATLTIRNDGAYPIRVEGLAKLKDCTYRSNPLDPRPFSLGWQEVDTREVTIKPNGVASLILAKVECTPQPDAYANEWFTLSFPEFGKTAPLMSQLWSRKEELRYALAVEIHCTPPAEREPTRHAISIGLKPPTAKLDIVVGSSALVERLAGALVDDLAMVRSDVIGPIASALAEDLERDAAQRTEPAPQGASVDDVKAVRTLAQAITASPTSPLPHPEKFANALTYLDRLWSEAATGDAHAIEAFCVTFQNAHALARDMWGSTSTYYDSFFHPYRQKLEELVKRAPEDRAESLVRLLDKMTASPSSPLAPETAMKNARTNLDALFQRAEAGDRRVLTRLAAVFEDAQGVATLLYGKTPRFFEFFHPAAERLKALTAEPKPPATPREPEEPAAAPPVAMRPAPVANVPKMTFRSGVREVSLMSLGISPYEGPSQTALGDLYKAGQRLHDQVRMEGRGIPGFKIGGPFETRQRISAWAEFTSSMVEKMPATIAGKPFRGLPLSETANLWEMQHYLERELGALDAYLKSL